MIITSTHDGFASIDGVTFEFGVSALEPGVHAIQWYDTYGVVEFSVGLDGYKPENQRIDSLDKLQPTIAQCKVVEEAHIAAIAAAEAAEEAAAGVTNTTTVV